jgi:hypothetical protein
LFESSPQRNQKKETKNKQTMIPFQHYWPVHFHLQQLLRFHLLFLRSKKVACLTKQVNANWQQQYEISDGKHYAMFNLGKNNTAVEVS